MFYRFLASPLSLFDVSKASEFQLTRLRLWQEIRGVVESKTKNEIPSGGAHSSKNSSLRTPIPFQSRQGILRNVTICTVTPPLGFLIACYIQNHKWMCFRHKQQCFLHLHISKPNFRCWCFNYVFFATKMDHRFGNIGLAFSLVYSFLPSPSSFPLVVQDQAVVDRVVPSLLLLPFPPSAASFGCLPRLPLSACTFFSPSQHIKSCVLPPSISYQFFGRSCEIIPLIYKLF